MESRRRGGHWGLRGRMIVIYFLFEGGSARPPLWFHIVSLCICLYWRHSNFSDLSAPIRLSQRVWQMFRPRWRILTWLLITHNNAASVNINDGTMITTSKRVFIPSREERSITVSTIFGLCPPSFPSSCCACARPSKRGRNFLPLLKGEGPFEKRWPRSPMPSKRDNNDQIL